jgi:hypothetical protein
VRLVALIAALMLAVPAVAQDDVKPKKKTVAKKKPASAPKNGRQKPTPEQIRKFNELQKKQKS